MTTFLLALRLSGDLEARMRIVQDTLIRDHGLVSARLLPPVIPLARASTQPREHDLDHLRRAMPIRLRGLADPEPPPGVVPWIGIAVDATLDANGSRPLTAAAPLLISAGATALERTLARPEIVLAWEGGPLPIGETPALPDTRALWLSLIEVRTYPGRSADGSRRPWWARCAWDEWYRRRVTVEPR